MKIELEDKDVEAVAQRVLELLRPHVGNNGKRRADDTIFDVQGLADYLKVDASWVYKQVSLKKIPYFKNGRYTRFKRSAIDKWIDSQTIKSIP